MESNPVCGLCRNPTEKQGSQERFSCGHRLCPECMPYLLLQFISSQGLGKFFCEDPSLQNQCLLCRTGYASMPLKKEDAGPTNQQGFPIGEAKAALNQLKSQFSDLRERFLQDLTSAAEAQIRSVDKAVDSLVNRLTELKLKNRERVLDEKIGITKRLTFVSWSLQAIASELEGSVTLKNGKIGFLNDFLRKKENLEVFKPEFSSPLFLSEALDSLSAALSKNNQAPLLSISKSLDFIAKPQMPRKTSEITDPSQLFSNKPVIISEMPFNCYRNRSKTACCFEIGKENFLVWPSNTDDSYYNPLVIFNVWKGKIEKIIEQKASVSVIQRFPKEDPRWFFTGDTKGNLQGFEIDQGKEFKEAFFVECFRMKTVFGMGLLEDRFAEVSGNEKAVYVFVACEDKNRPIDVLPLSEAKPKPILQISLPNSTQSCCLIDFYEDESAKKTQVFFAVQNIGVYVYDLRGRAFIQEIGFKIGLITSMSFVVDKEKFCVLTSKNKLAVVSLETWKAHKEASFSDVTSIFDVLVLGNAKKQLVLTTNNKDTLKILDFASLAECKSIINTAVCPVNAIKSRKNEKEVIFVVSSYGSRPLVIYE